VKSLPKFKPNLLIPGRIPSRLAGVFCFLVFLISACSTFVIPVKSKKKGNLVSGYQEMSSEDYSDQLASLKGAFLGSPGVRVATVDSATGRYLAALVTDIITNNEVFFHGLHTATVTIIDADAPLHFSLPQGQIFLSRGLISKYVKHESMLVAILSYELVKSEKVLYPKQTVIPTGYFPLERMISLNRLNLGEKMEVHKWAHHVTERSGYDGEYYLSWLQTQNRNTADFLLQVGDANQITREESLFKAFLIKTAKEEKFVAKKNSSKSFYHFINRIRETL
jgi:hypothetical protein